MADFEEYGLDPKPTYRKFYIEIQSSAERPLEVCKLLDICSKSLEELYTSESKTNKQPFLVDTITFNLREGSAYIFLRSND